jgi:ElaB/YqjD/DUF883 family membrane-anchored ribosome-binding protein
MPRTNEEKHGTRHEHSATDDLKEKAVEIGENVRQMGGQIGDVAREQYENLRDQATGYYKKGRKKASALEEEFEDYIKEKPIQTLLMAAGVGLLIGMFWRRR